MNKEIEIPFGAKDSELKGWEYTIPKGMEAEIKDGKIIVKKKKSEDERMRREIIEFLTDGIWRAKEISKVRETQRYAKWISYLERQKEQKPSTPEDIAAAYQMGLAEGRKKQKPALDDYLKATPTERRKMSMTDILEKEQKPAEVNDEGIELSDFEHELFSAFSDGWQQYLRGEEVNVAQWAKEHSAELLNAAKQELKPAEWSRQSIIDALTKWLTEKIAPLHKKSLDGTLTEREEMFEAALLEMRSLVNSPDFQIGKDTSAEWSEEDEQIRKEIIFLLKNADSGKELTTFHSTEEMIAWLEKPSGQKPAEWNEEDEQIYNSFKTICEILKNPHGEKFEADTVYAEKMLSWLKSLHPRPHWKPSEEQMEALYVYLYQPQYISNSDDERLKFVESLYNDLKKL